VPCPVASACAWSWAHFFQPECCLSTPAGQPGHAELMVALGTVLPSSASSLYVGTELLVTHSLGRYAANIVNMMLWTLIKLYGCQTELGLNPVSALYIWVTLDRLRNLSEPQTFHSCLFLLLVIIWRQGLTIRPGRPCTYNPPTSASLPRAGITDLHHHIQQTFLFFYFRYWKWNSGLPTC
jgi:hypothetical protein